MRRTALSAIVATCVAFSGSAYAATFTYTGAGNITAQVFPGGNANPATGSPPGSLPVGHTATDFLYRSALDFDLTGLAGLTIVSATLTLDPATTLGNVSGDIGNLVDLVLPGGFAGNLQAAFPTFASIGGAFLADIVAPTGAASGAPISFDVTAAVAADLLGGSSFTAFGLVDNVPWDGTNEYLAFGTNSDAVGKPVLTINAVPEPGTALLMGLGIAGLAGAGRRFDTRS